MPEPNWPPRLPTGHRGDERCWEYDDAHYALLIHLVNRVEGAARLGLTEAEDAVADRVLDFVQTYAQRSINLTLHARDLAAMYEESVTGWARDPSTSQELLSCTVGFFESLRLVVRNIGIAEMWGFDDVRDLLPPEHWDSIRRNVVLTCCALLDEDKYKAELTEARKTPPPSGGKVLLFRPKPR